MWITANIPVTRTPTDLRQQLTVDHWLMSAQTTYAYDQRDLLTSQTNWRIGEPDLQAAFVYDGDGRRVQMVDHTGSPRTITYSNDILGLTQVLLADDGATTTANLLGLDLIAQDNGSETRVLLADGLGSARVEMVGGVVETTTTYEPYGKLLAQTGSSGTTYGFTGEQEDAATGLVYLRSRYYSPYIYQMLSPDPIVPDFRNPQSLNLHTYVLNNPINFVDPTGQIACKDSSDPECIQKAQGLYVEAFSLKMRVQTGVLLPVEALARLADSAVSSFGEADGFMWGMSNVLLGIDPNKTSPWKLGLAGRYNIDSSANPFWIKGNWLKYRHNPSLGGRHSERGDWRPDFWDGTPNQAYHFWYFASVGYYDNRFIGYAGNLVHDPYFLEGICGDDLTKLDAIPGIGPSITGFTTETSEEDYRLSLKGIELGRGLWWSFKLPSVCVRGICTPSNVPWSINAPGAWIRTNLR